MIRKCLSNSRPYPIKICTGRIYELLLFPFSPLPKLSNCAQGKWGEKKQNKGRFSTFVIWTGVCWWARTILGTGQVYWKWESHDCQYGEWESLGEYGSRPDSQLSCHCCGSKWFASTVESCSCSLSPCLELGLSKHLTMQVLESLEIGIGIPINIQICIIIRHINWSKKKIGTFTCTWVGGSWPIAHMINDYKVALPEVWSKYFQIEKLTLISALILC